MKSTAPALHTTHISRHRLHAHSHQLPAQQRALLTLSAPAATDRHRPPVLQCRQHRSVGTITPAFLSIPQFTDALYDRKFKRVRPMGQNMRKRCTGGVFPPFDGIGELRHRNTTFIGSSSGIILAVHRLLRTHMLSITVTAMAWPRRRYKVNSMVHFPYTFNWRETPTVHRFMAN